MTRQFQTASATPIMPEMIIQPHDDHDRPPEQRSVLPTGSWKHEYLSERRKDRPATKAQRHGAGV
jgi:hypothetical protein